ncbi:MAG: hypothetical protein JWN73_378 [Betaproteobacteria bacterium]|nr:hypothetical protein [Betaproteobacteria bacterium]
MKFLIWIIGPVIVLAALLYTSTVTCACDAGNASLAGHMTIYTASGRDTASAAQNEALGRRAFIGRDINSLTERQPLDPECSYTRAMEINCDYWNEKGMVIRRGRHVRILAQPGGKVVQVTVVPTQEKGLVLFRG